MLSFSEPGPDSSHWQRATLSLGLARRRTGWTQAPQAADWAVGTWQSIIQQPRSTRRLFPKHLKQLSLGDSDD